MFPVHIRALNMRSVDILLIHWFFTCLTSHITSGRGIKEIHVVCGVSSKFSFTRGTEISRNITGTLNFGKGIKGDQREVSKGNNVLVLNLASHGVQKSAGMLLERSLARTVSANQKRNVKYIFLARMHWLASYLLTHTETCGVREGESGKDFAARGSGGK